MADYINRFRVLHEQKKSGTLSDVERPEYDTRLRELTHLALVAQQLGGTGVGSTKRRFLRAAVILDIEIDDGSDVERASTMDVAPRGFAVVLSRGLEVGTSIRFRLHVPTATVDGVASVASRRPQATGERVGFVFDQIDGHGREVLENALVDVLLQRFDEPQAASGSSA